MSFPNAFNACYGALSTQSVQNVNCIIPCASDFAIEMDLTVVQAGSALRHLVPELCSPGAKISDALHLIHPCTPWNLDHLLQFQWSSKVVLSSTQGLELKGGLFKVPQIRRDGDGRLVEGTDVVM